MMCDRVATIAGHGPSDPLPLNIEKWYGAVKLSLRCFLLHNFWYAVLLRQFGAQPPPLLPFR